MNNPAEQLYDALRRMGVECLTPWEDRPGAMFGTPPRSLQVHWGVDALESAAVRLVHFGLRLVFIPLQLPSTCVYTALIRHRNVYVRHLIDYLPGTDATDERFDACVMRAA